MTADNWLVISFRLIALTLAMQLILNVIGTNLYEIKETKRRRSLAMSPHTRRLRVSRLVSVIVVARNNERQIGICLRSLTNSTYRNFEIIVVDNASCDATRKRVKEFKLNHAKYRVTLMSRRTVKSQYQSALEGYLKYGSGELVAIMSADQTLDRRALNTAVKRFNFDTKLKVLTPKIRTATAYSSFGVLQKYYELAGYRTNKWNSALKSSYTLPASLICRREVLKSLLTSGVMSLEYAEDVIVNVSSVQTIEAAFGRLFSLNVTRVRSLFNSRKINFSYKNIHDVFIGMIRLPLALITGISALLIPFLLGYITYLAAELHEPAYLLSAVGLVTIFLVFAIWDDKQLNRRQKITFSFGIPLTYGPLAILTTVQAVAIIYASLTPLRKVH